MDNKQEFTQPDPQQPETEQVLAEEILAEASLPLPTEETMPDVMEAIFAEDADDTYELLDDAAVDAIIAELTGQKPITAASQEDLWENQEVDAPVLAEEIGVDEQAVAAAGLTHPEDLEFEKIMEETMLEAGYADPVLDEDQPEEPELTTEEESTEAEEAPTEEAAPAEESEEEEAAEEETQEDAEEEEMDMEEPDDRTPSKRRPKKRSVYGFFGIPHMVTTVIWLAIIVFIGVGLGNMVWNVAADMLAFGRENQVVTITITSNDDLDDIAQKLYETGLIKYPGIFKFYGKLANAEKKVKAGTYELNAIYDYNALVKNMAGYADRVSTKVVIPEGYTCAQIFRLLERSGVCTVEALEEAAMNAELNYWFLEGIDRSSPNCLEGYLFPDTYQFYLDYDATSVLKKLLGNFNKRFSDDMMAKLDELNETLASMMRSHGLSSSYIESHLFTVQDVIIVASMIEKETAGDEESYYIASVIYNRLTNPGEYPYLNIDATLVYITGNSPLTQEDLKLDSPYNTYLYKGLIPGAISNPGIASINAALSPESTEYYFYALNPATGEHKFFKTYKAHQNFLESLKKGD